MSNCTLTKEEHNNTFRSRNKLVSSINIIMYGGLHDQVNYKKMSTCNLCKNSDSCHMITVARISAVNTVQ